MRDPPFTPSLSYKDTLCYILVLLSSLLLTTPTCRTTSRVVATSMGSQLDEGSRGGRVLTTICKGAPPPSEHHRHHQSTTATIREPPPPSEHHLHHQSTTATIRAPPPPSEHHRHHQSTTATIRAPPPPSEHHRHHQSTTATVREPHRHHQSTSITARTLTHLKRVPFQPQLGRVQDARGRGALPRPASGVAGEREVGHGASPPCDQVRVLPAASRKRRGRGAPLPCILSSASVPSLLTVPPVLA